MIFTLLSIAAGCDSTEGEYRTFTECNEMCSFSFEYSTYYEKPDVHRDLSDEGHWIAFYLKAPPKSLELIVPDTANDTVRTVTSSYAPAYIHVMIIRPEENSDNAESRVDSTISHLARWENYELFDRSPITVSGIEGELIYYLVDWLLPVPTGEGPGLKYVREVYFDYDGLIWWLEAISELEMVDQVKADFEHLLETFQILD